MNNKFQLDVWKARLKSKIRKHLPHSIERWVEQVGRKTYYMEPARLLKEDIPPWTSPNVWGLIEEFYTRLEYPRLFEYGMGASSLKHFENIAKKGAGVYHGVEIDPDWYWIVATAIQKKAHLLADHVSVDITKRPEGSDDKKLFIDLHLHAGNVAAILHLRTDQDEYVNSLDRGLDVVVIDGAYRQDCVRHILSTSNLRSGGLLMLMEAGRGSPDWWEGKLTGYYDYSAELQMLLDLGAELVDGTGVDRWEGCTRKSPPPTSYFYPMEACKLIMPSQVRDTKVAK